MPDVRLTQFYYLLCRVVFKYYMVVLCTYSFCTYTSYSTCERGTHIMEHGALRSFSFQLTRVLYNGRQNRVLN